MPKVLHVFDAKGWHAVEVDGKCGEFTNYQAPAFNGDYTALTDYFGESIFKVEKLPYESHNISTYDNAVDDATDHEVLAARWQREKEAYIAAH